MRGGLRRSTRPAASTWSGLRTGRFLGPQAEVRSRPPELPASTSGPRPSEARMKPRPPGRRNARPSWGRILDFPILLDDPEVQAVLDAARGRFGTDRGGAWRSACGSTSGEKKCWTAPNSLRKCLPRSKPSRSARLAAPAHDTIDEARETVAVNAKKLRGTNVARETSEIVREQHRVVGDWDTEVELAKHADALVRQRQGLMPR